MKFKLTKRGRLLAGGSLLAVVTVAAIVPFNMGGCSMNGVDVGAIGSGLTKMVQAGSLTHDQEDAIGQSVALEATNKWKLYQDRGTTRYVTLVARTVAGASIEPDMTPNLAILDTDEVNAFSGPNGYIFITRGALVRMHDESELAGVLGHEIGHLCKHHGLQAVKNANFLDGLTTAAAGSNEHIAAFKGAADTAAKAVIVNGFSKAQEEEADAEGVKYVIAAGYDPNGFLHFLQRMRQEQGSGGNPFGTHPGIGDRIRLVRDQIAKANAAGQGAALPERFQKYAVLR